MRRKYLLIGIAIIAVTFVATLIVYPSLPGRIPTHWNVHDQVDGWSDRWMALVLMPGIMAAILALMAALPWLSPRKFEVNGQNAAYLQITIVILVFMAWMQFVMVASAMGKHIAIGRAVLGGICAMFAAMGFLLPRVPRNFYVGIRTPWTLANERVWEATHRFAAKTFVGGGALGLVLALLSSAVWPPMVTIGVGALVPVVHSLVFYKQLEHRGEA